MKIFVLSFVSCKEYVSRLPNEKTSILSIRDPLASPYFSLDMNKNIYDILTLNFSDKSPLYPDEFRFNKEKAESIVDFIYESIDNNVENILIHCNLGLSRSKTVGIVIYEKLKGIHLPKHIGCNKHIYSTLNTVWEENLKERKVFYGEIITNFVKE